MQAGAVQADTVRRTTRSGLSDLARLVLEIAVPVALVNLVGALALMGWLSISSILPQCLSVACSVWVVLVLHSGPLLAPTPRKETGKE